MQLLRLAFLLAFLPVTFYCTAQPDLTINDLSKKTAVAETMKQYGIWKEAMLSNDTSKLSMILSADFKLNGRVEKNEWLNNLTHRKTDSITVLDPEFTIYTNAVKVDCLIYWKYSEGDLAEEERMLTTDIWILKEGKLFLQTRLWNKLRN